MEFMKIEGDRSEIDMLTKKEKALNILIVLHHDIAIWANMFNLSSTEGNLNSLNTMRFKLDMIERLLENDR